MLETLFVVILLQDASFAGAIDRTIGPYYDEVFQNLTIFCNIINPESFSYENCTGAIDCVYGNISPSFSQALSIGGSISGLLPTILVLIGSPPLELIQTALLSPHRALATCCFTIGLPVTLFRQLRPLHQQLAHSNPLEPRVREWTFNLSSLSPGNRKKHLFFKIVADMLVLALAAIMIWQNYGVNSYVMIPWRCNSTWLVLAWPVACMAWLLIAVSMMLILKESITIHNAEDSTITYSIWRFMTLPYTLDMKPNSKKQPPELPKTTKDARSPEGSTTETIQVATCSVDIIEIAGKGVERVPISRTETFVSYGEHCITVKVVMPTNLGFRSWRTLEAFIEVMAVGIYLYATFILMSLVFFTAQRAIVFAIQMSICLSFVRIIGLLF
ncbi:hypothetical protein Egran_01278 [Elaphomyces granulatus]|uniref:Uncharacterized protein n=1 Tax=Elaphomyces granulatus TaxID=519963 RepID=A0A232M3G7_9EURO|nr:hypothetical protein Egran_01278 [Elaphomyces granulatus]